MFSAAAPAIVRASHAQIIQFSGGAAVPPASLWPDATNTGYQNATGGPPTLYTGGAITSNTSYSNKIFDGGIDVGASGAPVVNVHFYGCWFRGHGSSGVLSLLFGDNITFDYCSFTPDTVSAPPTTYAQGYQYGIEGDGSFNTTIAQLTVTNCDIWGFGNAIDITGSTQAKPQVFRDNWIHDARADGGIDHTDGIGSLSGAGTGSYVVLDHNNIQSVGNTNGIAFQAGSYSNFQITNNLLGGFGYCVAILGGATNITFTDNVFSTLLPVGFGPLYPDTFWTSAQGSLWRRNKWSVPAGAAWGNPAHDGWFWIPDSSNSPTVDTPFVSQTDYTG